MWAETCKRTPSGIYCERTNQHRIQTFYAAYEPFLELKRTQLRKYGQSLAHQMPEGLYFRDEDRNLYSLRVISDISRQASDLSVRMRKKLMDGSEQLSAVHFKITYKVSAVLQWLLGAPNLGRQCASKFMAKIYHRTLSTPR
ncbi:hypothetical protein AVEN_220148-1 [Araneus ventricosus]|uniref:Uncharacterized protein n=1 Tax=Araneus ventricosus TaxID=182803 RepID=A0A4Y2UJA7_ARAVE|nr:hypothetical protein AVEN_220148-1 [Araneus ventricosus]